MLPLQIEIPNCKNVFLLKVPDELQVGGHFAIAFGHFNFVLLHIDPEIGPAGHQVLGIKNINNISPDNSNDHINTIKIFLADLQALQKQSISQVKFVLGCGSNQKLVELTIQIARHQESQESHESTLMFNSVDRVIHQHQTSIKQRVSNFFTSKLGYGSQDDTSQKVIDVHPIGGVFALLTSKDIIIVSSQDGNQLFQIGYMEELMDTEKEYESKRRDIGMRELIQLKYLTSDVHEKEEELVFNVYSVRIQIDRSTYQSEQEVTIIWQSFFIREDQTIKFAQPSRTLFINIPQYQISDICKCFSLNFDSSQDQRCLIGLESMEGKALLIEVSKDENLTNFKTYSNQRILGYAVHQEDVLSLTLITSSDIECYRFDPSTYIDLKQSPPLSKKEELGRSKQDELLQTRHEVEPISQIVDKERLRTFIYRILDEYANWYTQEQYKDSYEEPSHLQYKIEQLLSNLTMVQFCEEIKNLVIESLDQQLSGNLFTGVRDLQEQYLFSDDGLILSTIETKEKKLDVIRNFIVQFKLNSADKQTNLISFIDAMTINLQTARSLREYQEDLKTQLQRNKSQVLNNKAIPLEVKLLNTVIQRTAGKFKYDQSALKQRGTTALNVVFSFITQFDVLLQTLIETCLDGNLQDIIDISQQEDKYDVLIAGTKIMMTLLNNAISNVQHSNLDHNTAYIARLDFLQSIFQMITLIHNGISVKAQNERLKEMLIQYSDLLMRIMFTLEMGTHDKCGVWKSNIVVYIEQNVGIAEAIAFAEKYYAKELLCRLVYDGGKQFYPVLHRCIDKWRQEFLGLALQIIYDQEKLKVKGSQKGRSVEQIRTVDKIVYSGFVMFDIFEEKYLNDLIYFIERRNTKLYTLLMLRHRGFQKAEQNLCIEVPRSKLNDTIKSLASLAKVNSQRFTQSDYEQYYSAKYQLADLQQKFIPDLATTQKVDETYLDKVLQINLNKSLSVGEALMFQCYILDLAIYDTPPDQFKVLNHHVWNQVLLYDADNLKRAQNMLPGEQTVDVYTEKEIKDQVEQTLFYKIGKEQQRINKTCILDLEERDLLLNQNKSLQKGLSLVFRLLDTSSISQALFATGIQSSFSRFIPGRRSGGESQDSQSFLV